MNATLALPLTRFLHTLAIVVKEGRHLAYSWNSLSKYSIDVDWVNRLEQNPDCAEQLDARNLRNRLVHEYMTDPAKFIEDVALAKEYSLMLMDTFNRLRQDAMTRMGYKQDRLPEALTLPVQLND